MASITTPPEGSDQLSAVRGYVPGSNPTAEAYDLPQGTQGVYDPDRDVVPSAGSNHTVFVNESDPFYAFSNSPLNPEDRNYVQLPGTDFDEDDDFIAIPVTD